MVRFREPYVMKISSIKKTGAGALLVPGVNCIKDPSISQAKSEVILYFLSPSGGWCIFGSRSTTFGYALNSSGPVIPILFFLSNSP